MKNNMKIITMFIFGIITAVGITTIAYTINGKNILVKVNGWNVKNVDDAVNYLKNTEICPGLKPSPVKIKSGDLYTKGSILLIDGEEYYVYSTQDSYEFYPTYQKTTQLFPMNNLDENGKPSKDNYVTTTYADSHTATNTTCWKQYSCSKQYTNIYQYTENSKEYLKGVLGVDSVNDNIDSRLLKRHEFDSLPTDVRKAIGTGYDLDSCCTGGTTDYSRIFTNTSGSTDYGNFYHDSTIRPMIIIKTSILEDLL